MGAAMRKHSAPAGKESDILAEESKTKPNRGRAVKARVITLCAIVAGWLALDAATKAVFLAYPANALVGGPYLGLIDFRVVHNTGGAWGMLSNSTVALGVFSLIVCAALAVYFVITVREQGWLATVGIALIIAGGIGNAIDRFVRGFVMDFIEFSFFDFPVFNVADIGVTCGFVLLILGLLIYGVREDDDGDEAAAQGDGAQVVEGAADDGYAQPADDAKAGVGGDTAANASEHAQTVASPVKEDGDESAGER